MLPELRLKRIAATEKAGLWCNWQHDGLLIRSVRVQLPSAPSLHIGV